MGDADPPEGKVRSPVEDAPKPMVTPEEKFRVISSVLPIVAKNPHLIISGSLAQRISILESDGRWVLRPEDLVYLNDIDIGSTTWSTETVIQAMDQAVGPSEFTVEVNPLPHNCIYNPAVRDLAVQWANIQIGGPHQASFRIAYTTPAYLLLSLADGQVNEKTPAEKYRRKVTAIQRLPQFSPSDFITLTRSELGARYNMNKETFELWRKRLLGEPVQDAGLPALLKTRFADVDSLVDPTQLFNLIKTRTALETVGFNDIRRIPFLERFLSEFQAKIDSHNFHN